MATIGPKLAKNGASKSTEKGDSNMAVQEGLMSHSTYGTIARFIIGGLVMLFVVVRLQILNYMEFYSHWQEEELVSIHKFFVQRFDNCILNEGMPRKPLVPLEEQINVIKEFMTHFVTNEFPGYTSSIWKEMSNYLGGRYKAHDLYRNVREDRNRILSRARDEMGIAVLDVNKKEPKLQEIDQTASNAQVLSHSEDDAWSPHERTKKRKKKDQEKNTFETTEFELVLTEKEWDSMKPKGTVLYGNREKEILQPEIWTNVISIAFWKQHKTNCAFVYKRATVKRNENDQSYIVDIQGKCKSSTCGNIFVGHGEKHRNKEGLIMLINTRDTCSDVHEEVKRPLNGKRRIQAAQEMVKEGCAVWKRRQAKENMEYGDLEPAFLPNADVMRQARKQRIHADLNVEPSDSRDLIRTIEKISTQPEYRDLIHAVGSSPFYTFYSTPAQLDAYKKYVRLKGSKSTICVDATGSVVRKLDRDENSKSGHIFLYSIIINFEGTTQPVYQMLSEKHDTDFIEYWLKQWIRKGAPKPKEAVSDYSRALISALSLAFNNRTIKSYLNICFAMIENTHGVIERPATIIRIDVAHLIHSVCRWDSLRKANLPCIKDFFVRCVALMVECETLAGFEKIFMLTCAVGLQQFEDSELEISDVKTPKHARKKLEAYIASRGIELKLKEHEPRTEVDYTSGPFEFVESEDTAKLDDDTKAGTRLVEWVEQRKRLSEKCLRTGRNANAFYLPAFIEQIYKLAKEFPLWTGVAVPSASPHATSSYVESYHNDIKNRVFVEIHLPARLDIFLKHIARNIIGETKLFASKITKEEMKVKSNWNQAESREAQTIVGKMESADARLASRQVEPSMGEAENAVAGLGSQQVELSIGEAENVVAGLESQQVELSIGEARNAVAELESQHASQSIREAENATFLDDGSCFVDSTLSIMADVTLNELDFFSADNRRQKISFRKEFNANEQPTIVDEVPYLFDETTPLFANIVTLDDSDLFSAENWRGKAPVSRDIDDFGDVEADYDDRKCQTDVAESSITESNRLDHSYAKLNSSSSPMKPSNIAAVEESTENFNSRSINECKMESYIPQIDSRTAHSGHERYLPDENLFIDERDFFYDEAASEGKNISSSSERDYNAVMKREELQPAKTSKYFRSYPEIRQRNLLTTKLKSPHLLPNGSLCTKGVVIDGNTLFIRHTCAFDSLLHTVMTSAIDNPQYAAFLTKSQNSTLKLISDFLDSGVTKNILRERVSILRPFYECKPAIKTESRVLSYTIDTWDSIENVVKHTLKSEPSVYRHEKCSSCGDSIANIASISPNHNIIVRKGFKALQSALAFKAFVNGVMCRCHGTFTLINEPNIHLFIDLDVRRSTKVRGADGLKKVLSTSGLRGKLNDFPLTMDLTVKGTGHRSKITVKYSLTGIIGFNPGHFIAYCRRATGVWEVFNDMEKKISQCSSNTEIEPHLALYVRQMTDAV